jgi:hypothetical protein
MVGVFKASYAVTDTNVVPLVRPGGGLCCRYDGTYVRAAGTPEGTREARSRGANCYST